MLMRVAPTATAAVLTTFRHDLHACLTGWGDTLFELTDAILVTPTPVHSIPHLSLEPTFRRSHASLYKALERGHIDTDVLRRLLVANRPAGWPAVFAVDASTWDRCDAETSPERGFYYHASKHSNGQPIVAGWSYQWISQLNWQGDSWTAPLDARRLAVSESTTDATIAQVTDLVGLLNDDDHDGEDGDVPMFVFDAGYDPIALGDGLADTRCQILVRIRNDRVFYPDPPARHPGQRGRPRRHGDAFRCADPDTWTGPDDTLEVADRCYGTVTVQAWHDLHPKLGRRGRWADHDRPPIIKGTVIRVQVERLPRPSGRHVKTLWLWWSGPGLPDLDLCWRAYLRRFDIEHTYRFAKNTLGWTTPSVRTPQQADRWTWLIVAAYTQLRLARGLVDDHRLPWEKPRPPDKLTPARVRRGFRRIGAPLATPASPPKTSAAGPGRPKGTRKPPRTRYPAIKKAA